MGPCAAGSEIPPGNNKKGLNTAILKRPTVKRAFLYTLAVVFTAAILFYGFRPTSAKEAVSREFYLMGTLCRITVPPGGADHRLAESAAQAAADEIRAVESATSAKTDSSDIGRVNVSAGKGPVKIGERAKTVLSRSIFWAKRTDGAFDPSVGPVVSLWKIGAPNARVPEKQEIKEALKHVAYGKILLSGDEVSIPENFAIDLGAIAKGYAADRSSEIMRGMGVKSGIVDIGGNVVVWGKKDRDSEWKVGIQHPQKERGNIIGFIKTDRPLSIVTSGTYERFYEKDGVRYHHIFDPATGFPSSSGLLSVTVVTDSSMDGDALSTALFVMGLEKASAFLEKNGDIEALLVSASDNKDGENGEITVYSTGGPMRGMFSPDTGSNPELEIIYITGEN